MNQPVRNARAAARGRRIRMPHDCPSTCALDGRNRRWSTIGRIRGAADNDYTSESHLRQGGAYAERAHHKDRLLHAATSRKGRKGSDEFVPIAWDDALDYCEAAAAR